MIAAQARTNSRYIVESEQGRKNDFDVSVPSSDDESSPSETSLDDACEAVFDCAPKALAAGILAQGHPKQLGNQCALSLESLGSIIRVVSLSQGAQGRE